ncbi:hypothetical protein [Caloramator sp. Dgby_cultured_2]|uniref:hypothetical protein n=1 Tax=Caloramator sp. Dgby_cultured_2 TaxID=3029174 RepID=UPI00237EAE83|nr:hypothetical protein [Caloramator sp. Dgby_cultured_2]WDU82367.1 hypothetical protein PWK10_11955 [Caloramator sp. Dgby_cultured_2]
MSSEDKKGVLGTGTFSWTYYGDEDNNTILYCQKGILKIYDNPEFPIIIDKGKEKVYYRLDSIQTNENQTKSGVIDEFVNCIIKGSKPFATVYDGVAALKVIIKAMESARTGNKIKIV